MGCGQVVCLLCVWEGCEVRFLMNSIYPLDYVRSGCSTFTLAWLPSASVPF